MPILRARQCASQVCPSQGRYGGNRQNSKAFARYESILRPFIAGKQKSAQGFAKVFAPRTAFGVFFRNQMSKTMSIPFFAELTIGRSFSDKIALPDYSMSRAT